MEKYYDYNFNTAIDKDNDYASIDDWINGNEKGKKFGYDGGFRVFLQMANRNGRFGGAERLRCVAERSGFLIEFI